MRAGMERHTYQQRGVPRLRNCRQRPRTAWLQLSERHNNRQLHILLQQEGQGHRSRRRRETDELQVRHILNNDNELIWDKKTPATVEVWEFFMYVGIREQYYHYFTSPPLPSTPGAEQFLHFSKVKTPLFLHFSKVKPYIFLHFSKNSLRGKIECISDITAITI